MKNILLKCLLTDCLSNKHMHTIKGGDESTILGLTHTSSVTYQTDNNETETIAIENDPPENDDDTPIWQT